MKFTFCKYQATGNDFIMIDNRSLDTAFSNPKLVQFLCDRRFGIGADGLILLQERKGYDFEMVYFNSDGNESSMCGNGGRCIVAFAKQLGIIKNEASFIAPDGEHLAIIDEKDGTVSLKMQDVNKLETLKPATYFLNTGSPHFISFVDDVEKIDVDKEGKRIRYSERFSKEGTNVNFIKQVNPNLIEVRTYERGVEAETYSCGTGVTAAVLATSFHTNNSSGNSYAVRTKGGDLEVKFKRNEKENFSDIWLKGPATFVFKGEFDKQSFK